MASPTYVKRIVLFVHEHRNVRLVVTFSIHSNGSFLYHCLTKCPIASIDSIGYLPEEKSCTEDYRATREGEFTVVDGVISIVFFVAVEESKLESNSVSLMYN
jgi:hypothetical protein